MSLMFQIPHNEARAKLHHNKQGKHLIFVLFIERFKANVSVLCLIGQAKVRASSSKVKELHRYVNAEITERMHLY